MIFNRSDIHFRNDDTHRFVPWLIGVMSCLAMLLLYMGISINGWIASGQSSYSGSFTVTIPGTADNMAEKISEVREMLLKFPGVEHVALLNDTQIKELLAPWLGEGKNLDGLPLPAVFDAQLTDPAKPMDYDTLQQRLSALAPGAEVDARERWVAAFSNFSRAAQLLMLMFSCLIIAAMGSMIAFAARASLKLHARTVGLLHAIGAEDRYIARQFQAEALRLSAPGVLAGCAIATLVYCGMGWYMSTLPASLLPSLSLNAGHLWLLIAMPPVCSLAASVVARLSVMAQLRSVL